MNNAKNITKAIGNDRKFISIEPYFIPYQIIAMLNLIQFLKIE